MGESSDYFEDFPEENTANGIDGQFNPEASRIRARARKSELERERENKGLRDKIAATITRHRPEDQP